MDHYRQSLVVQASPRAVYAALTTEDGLRGWWTSDCSVTSEVGGAIHLQFGRLRKALRIERLEPAREARWRCTFARILGACLTRTDEWEGTELVFRLAPDGDGRTRLDFAHLGLEPTLECYGMCSDGWQHFLQSLRRFTETGHGAPYAAPVPATTATHIRGGISP